MKKKHGYGGERSLGRPPRGGHKSIGGITVPAMGAVANGARMTSAVGSAGEKGRAYDPNCDKVRAKPGNP